MISLNYQEVKADIDFRMKNFDNLLLKNQNIESQGSTLVIENDVENSEIDVSEPILAIENDVDNSDIDVSEPILTIENDVDNSDIDVSEPILNLNNEANISAVENKVTISEVNNDYNTSSVEFVKKKAEEPVSTIKEKLIPEQTSAPEVKFELKEIDDPEYKPESFGIIGTIKSYLNLFGN